MALIARSRRKQQFQQWAESRREVSISEMIAMLDVQSLLIDAPSTSVRQTIDVERLEDEIVSEPPAVSGSHAITLGDGSTDKIAAAFSDYDTVSEQVCSTTTILVYYYYFRFLFNRHTFCRVRQWLHVK